MDTILLHLLRFPEWPSSSSSLLVAPIHTKSSSHFGFSEMPYFRQEIWLLEWLLKPLIMHLGSSGKTSPCESLTGNESWEAWAGKSSLFSSLHGRNKVSFSLQPLRRKSFVLSKQVCPANCASLWSSEWSSDHRDDDLHFPAFLYGITFCFLFFITLGFCVPSVSALIPASGSAN